ncbi:NOB1 family endonuclease [Candidatus Thorarchaeota archaeon]|nr:MAG: NOB1 family endonuclease [Candidatus Thorarchaeota archaeon]
MSQIYVLDAGVLFSSWTSKIPEGKFVTTSSVLEEIKNRPSQVRAEVLTLLDRLQEDFPTPESLKAVRLAAAKTGDLSVLSDVDIEIIALAYSKKSIDSKTTLVSTDLAILNTARHLGIHVIDPNRKFKHEIVWALKCPACKHKSRYRTTNLECPVCGTIMRRFVHKKHKSH